MWRVTWGALTIGWYDKIFCYKYSINDKTNSLVDMTKFFVIDIALMIRLMFGNFGKHDKTLYQYLT